MKIYLIEIDGRDEGRRFATKAEAQMLADVYQDDYPEAIIMIAECENGE